MCAFMCAALDDRQETSLIEIMVCCVRQAATGESPVGRGPNRKVHRTSLPQGILPLMAFPSLLTSTVWVYFVWLNFQHTKIQEGEKNHQYFWTCFAVRLFFNPEYTQFLVFGDTSASLTTSWCRSFGFCVTLFVVAALTSQAIQSEACISTAKYKHSPFLPEVVLPLF